jgi:peptidyl-prolyl cis-trans isomerase SurA
MKKVFFSLFILSISQFGFSQKDQVVMDINGEKVTKSEFLQIYLKNNNDPKYDKTSLDDYIELFKKFKLKVAEAEALGYDTIPKLKKELEGYRKQLANPYLIDSASNNSLVLEAYDRFKTEVRVSHILLRVDPNALPKDTLDAYNRITALKNRIEKGEDFSSVAKMKNGSEDPSAINNGGDLGYFTAFQMVYSFEEMAYSTAVGMISEPFRTRFGYHILKVTDKRPSRGTIKVAHIMIAAGKDIAKETSEAAEKKINELYEKLQKGEKWEDLVTLHSDDANSVKKAGELPAFGSGTTQRMVPAFEEASFLLKKDGDYSRPIKTDYGFHIIKRLELKDVQSFETVKKELQAKVNKDERSKKTQDSFVLKLKKTYKYKYSGNKNLQWFIKNIDSTYYLGKWNTEKLKTNKVLFKLGGKTFKQNDFANYLKQNYRGVRREEAAKLIDDQYKNYEKAAILEFEESKLSDKYPEYKALVKEYHDGIILYEIMSDKVWNKAVKDTSGLKNFFEQNRSKYTWSDRIDATVYECLNKQIAETVFNMIKNDTINSKHVLDIINKESELNLKVKMNKFETNLVAYLKNRNFKPGVNPIFEFEGKYYAIKVNDIIKPMNKEFSEAKGTVTSDYQNFLEKSWMDELQKKYTITIYPDVLYKIGEN